MNRDGKINIQDVLNANSSRTYDSNNWLSPKMSQSSSPQISQASSPQISQASSFSQPNSLSNRSVGPITNISASPITLSSVLYKITGQGQEYNITNEYIQKLKTLPISRKQSGYEITIKKVIVRGGRKKALVQIQPSSGVQNLRGIEKERPNLIELTTLVKKGNDEVGASIVIYYSGIVTITMGILGNAIVNNNARSLLTQQVEAVKQGVIQEFFPFIQGTGKFTNISGQFKFNKQFNQVNLVPALQSTYGVRDVTPPLQEIALPAYRFNYGEVKCSLFPTSGVCQLFRATTLDELTTTRQALLSSAQSGALSVSVGGPVVNTGAAKPKGKAKKININKRAPGVIRVGTSCPKDRLPDKKTGKCPEKFYKKPNAQGDMCCYKIPKTKSDKFKQKVIQAYKNFKKEIPTNVKKALNINDSDINTNRIEGVLLGQFALNNKGRMKIKKRLCTEYTKTQLVDFATRIGLIIDPDKQLKGDICLAIYQEWRRQIGAGGGLEKINILGKQRTNGYLNLKIDDKKCKYWTRGKLIEWAKNRGIIINPKTTKLEVCRILYERANKNSRFDSNLENRAPIVKVLNNKVLIHNRNLNKYSLEYLSWAAKKLKLPLPANANINDIKRRFYVKYVSKPAVSTRGGQLRIMNRDAKSYSRVELREIARKLPDVKVKASANEKQILDAIYNSTNNGKIKAITNRVEKLSPNLQKAFRKRSFLTPDEKFKIIELFNAKSSNVLNDREARVRKLKTELNKAKRNLAYYNKNNSSLSLNNILEMNDEDEVRAQIISLKAKIKRIESQNVDDYKLLKITDRIYNDISKQKGFKSRYLTIAKTNNINMGAVSLAKSNIQNIVYSLVVRNMMQRQTKSNKKNKSPTKPTANTIDVKVRRAINKYSKQNNGPSNIALQVSKDTGVNINTVRKMMNKPLKSKVKSLNIEWFIGGNRKVIRVKANDDEDINELTTKSRLKNDMSTTRNRMLKQVVIYYREPLSKKKDIKEAVKNAEIKIRKILNRKVPNNVMYNI